MAFQPVFSSQFIVSNDETGTGVFEVPSGSVAVIRDFSVWLEAGGALVQLQIQNSSVAPAVVAAQVSTIGVPGYAQWQGRVVVPPGGIMSIASESLGSGLHVYVGGYLLANTP